MNFYPAPPEHVAEVFCTIPDSLRCTGQQTDWRGGSNPASLSIFLEGPTTDAQGNLFVVDVPYGRIIKIDSLTKQIDVQAQWDGEPNGLAITHDGYFLVADYKRGLLLFDPDDCSIVPFLARRNLESWKGLNDLVVDSHGNVYFTDQGQTGMTDPTGGVFRLSPDGQLTQLVDNGVSPNGIVLSPDEKWLYVAMTRSNSVWRMPIHPDGTTTKANLFFQSFGNSGPDGLTIDAEGNLFVCHPSLATVFVVDKHGLPVCRIKGRGSGLVTNIIFGGPNNDVLFFTDSLNGHIFSFPWHCPGGTPIRQSRAHSSPFERAQLPLPSVTKPIRFAPTRRPADAKSINVKPSSPQATYIPDGAANGYDTPPVTDKDDDSEDEPIYRATARLPFKVYAPDNFHSAGLERARQLFETVVTMQDDEVNDWPQDAHGLMSRAKPITAQQINAAKQLQVISKQGIGVDTIDVQAAKECGITIVNTPGINAEAVAELTYGLVVSLKRRITEADRRMRSGERIVATDCMGSSLHGKTVGLVGMGNIGKATARMFSIASGCKLIAYDPYAPADAWSDLPHKRVDRIEDILMHADVLSLHVPLTKSTRDLIGQKQLSMMKKEAVIVNASRGGIINEADLFDALRDRTIAGAALDTLEHEPASREHYGKTLFTLDNLVLTPHLGAATDEMQAKSAVAVADNLAAVLGDRPASSYFNKVL